jgi:5-methylcytosine-specific restriction endonuclease McrA
MSKWLDEMTNAGEPLIPENLKNLVWERDEGQCFKCGAVEDVGVHCIEPYGMPTEQNTKVVCKKCRMEL